MGTMTQIIARDGHSLDAYLARPAYKPRGAIVIGQEMSKGHDRSAWGVGG